MRDYILRYGSPASDWYSALPLGNGRLGAMVYGSPETERVQLNEETMWSGIHDDGADNPECAAMLGEIRRLLFENKTAEAERMTGRYLVCRGAGSGNGHGYGHAYGSYQSAGELFIGTGLTGYDGYLRVLRLNDGCATVTFTSGGVKYTRHAVCSAKYNVTAIRFTADRPHSVDAALSFERENCSVAASSDRLTVTGELNDGKPEFSGKAVRYATVILASTKGGINKIDDDEPTLAIKGADEVTLYISTATDFAERCLFPDKSDFIDGKTPLERADDAVNAASEAGWDAIYNANADFYGEMLGRCDISVAADRSANAKYTDERLADVRAGVDDDALYELHFQYGRYLLVSSSYRCQLPANLQGVWADTYSTIWSADYHININLQMNYWPANLTGLSELEDVHFRYIKMLSEAGKTTAETQYGLDGWVAHTITNPWGFTSPGEGASWGSFMCAGAWECEHIWKRWQFTRDIGFLREYYPVMRGAAEFMLGFLTEDPRTGCLVTAPSNSPENSFIDENGVRGAITAGPTMDNTILYELFTNVAETEKILGIGDGISAAVLDARERLAPIKLGKHGQIMEWQFDYDEPEPGHRHISPLYGLHPSDIITKSKTPELFEGAKRLIERRLSSGGGHTGWSRAWIINFKARLGDGETIRSNIRALLAKSTLPNLFDNHPPFQIDGNFGYVSGVCEMLMQSHEGFVNLLPALPAEWKNGSFSGLRAMGGVSVSAEWTDGRVTSLTLLSDYGGDVKVCANGETFSVDCEAGIERKVSL